MLIGASCCDLEAGECGGKAIFASCYISDPAPLTVTVNFIEQQPLLGGNSTRACSKQSAAKRNGEALRQGPSIRLEVHGMTCSDCAARLENHIWRIPYVTDLAVSALTHKAEVWTSLSADRSSIIKAVLQGAEALGFTAKELPSAFSTRLLLQLPSTSSSSHSLSDQALQPLRECHGVLSATALPASRQLQLEFTADAAPRDLIRWVEQQCHATVSILPERRESSDDREAARWGVLMIAAALLAIPVLILEQFMPLWPAAHRVLERSIVGGLTFGVLLQWLLSTPVQFAVAAPLYVSAWKCALNDHSANMDTLVVLSSTTAYIYSYESFVFMCNVCVRY